MKPAKNHTQGSPWQCRRMALIERALADVKRDTASGNGLMVALGKVAARYNGRRLGGGHFLRLNIKTLERFWYASLKHGNLDALRLKFGHSSGSDKIPAYVRYLCRALAAKEGLNVPDLYARLQAVDAALPFSQATLRRVIPAKELATAKRACLAATAAVRRMQEAQGVTLAVGQTPPQPIQVARRLHPCGRTCAHQTKRDSGSRPARGGGSKVKRGSARNSAAGKD